MRDVEERRTTEAAVQASHRDGQEVYQEDVLAGVVEQEEGGYHMA